MDDKPTEYSEYEAGRRAYIRDGASPWHNPHLCNVSSRSHTDAAKAIEWLSGWCEAAQREGRL